MRMNANFYGVALVAALLIAAAVAAPIEKDVTVAKAKKDKASGDPASKMTDRLLAPIDNHVVVVADDEVAFEEPEAPVAAAVGNVDEVDSSEFVTGHRIPQEILDRIAAATGSIGRAYAYVDSSDFRNSAAATTTTTTPKSTSTKKSTTTTSTTTTTTTEAPLPPLNPEQVIDRTCSKYDSIHSQAHLFSLSPAFRRGRSARPGARLDLRGDQGLLPHPVRLLRSSTRRSIGPEST